jgi:hypothetical protein
MINKFDRDGKPISLSNWTAKLENDHYRQVAWTEVGDYRVSTIWLGLDYSFGGNNPLIFETVVFDGYSKNIFQFRHSTEEEALEGHARVIAQLEANVENVTLP